MQPSAKQKMVVSAAQLIRERGVQGTSFSDVIERSGAPRGSIYHHFPGGKAQLVDEATEFAGGWIAAGMERVLDEGGAAGAMRAFADGWRATLVDSGYAAGCPVVAVAVEGDEMRAARDRAAGVFERWLELLRQRLERDGFKPERAATLATLVVTSIEGAIVVCRAQRSIEPLDRVVGELTSLVSTRRR